MTRPPSSPPLSPALDDTAPDGGSNLSTAFLALVGAVAGGTPQLVIPTATLIEFLGNSAMGAIIVAVLDSMLVRRTLQGRQLRTGRILLIVFVSVTLTLVTYKPASLVFQTVLGTAPPQQIRNLHASSHSLGRIGHIAHRLSFITEPIGLQPVFERMETLKNATYLEASGTDFPAFLDAHAPDEPFTPAARTFKSPVAHLWRTPHPTDPTRQAQTLLLYDQSTGQTFVLHTPG